MDIIQGVGVYRGIQGERERERERDIHIYNRI